MRLGWIVLAAVMLAGCFEAGSTGGDAQGSSGATPTQPEASADTGSLVVLVTNGEFEAVPGAQVALSGTELAALTDEGGQATFNGLQPATYTVLVAKAGYKSQSEKGKLVDVPAAEIVEIKMVLEPEAILASGDIYHKSLVFNGLIACSTAGSPSTGIGYTSYPCRGVNVAGVEFRDPNENSTHPWEVDNMHIQSMLLEAKWTPSNGLNGKQLHMGAFKTFSCTGSGTQAGVCLPSGDIVTGAGVSPLYMVRHETDMQNLTKRMATTPDKYPFKLFTAVRAACTGNADCPTVGSQFQQKYEAWATSFYGAEAPAGWSIYNGS